MERRFPLARALYSGQPCFACWPSHLLWAEACRGGCGLRVWFCCKQIIPRVMHMRMLELVCWLALPPPVVNMTRIPGAACFHAAHDGLLCSWLLDRILSKSLTLFSFCPGRLVTGNYQAMVARRSRSPRMASRSGCHCCGGEHSTARRMPAQFAPVRSRLHLVANREDSQIQMGANSSVAIIGLASASRQWTKLLL